MSARRSTRGRGGKGGHEPRSRVRLREMRVLDLVLEGRPQYQIAEALGISQPAVSKIARRVEERLLADVGAKADHQRARLTLRLEHLFAQSMQAWQASKQDGLRRRQRKTDRDDGAGSTVAEVISENRHGDPRYLDEARKALADLRKLWGVDAPERLSIDAVSHVASLSDEALELELMRQLQLMRSAPAVVDVAPAALPDTSGEHDEHH